MRECVATSRTDKRRNGKTKGFSSLGFCRREKPFLLLSALLASLFLFLRNPSLFSLHPSADGLTRKTEEKAATDREKKTFSPFFFNLSIIYLNFGHFRRLLYLSFKLLFHFALGQAKNTFLPLRRPSPGGKAQKKVGECFSFCPTNLQKKFNMDEKQIDSSNRRRRRRTKE